MGRTENAGVNEPPEGGVPGAQPRNVVVRAREDSLEDASEDEGEHLEEQAGDVDSLRAEVLNHRASASDRDASERK